MSSWQRNVLKRYENVGIEEEVFYKVEYYANQRGYRFIIQFSPNDLFYPE